MAPRKVKRKPRNDSKGRKVLKPKKVEKLFTIVCDNGKCRVYRVFETKKRRFVVMTKKGKKTVYCIRKGHPVFKSRPTAVLAAKKVIRSPATCKIATKKQKMTKQPAAKGRKAMKDFVDAGKGVAKKMPVAVKDAVSGRATDTFKFPTMADIRKRLTGKKAKFGAKKNLAKKEKKKSSAKKADPKKKMTPAQKARLKKVMKALVTAGGIGAAGKKVYNKKKKGKEVNKYEKLERQAEQRALAAEEWARRNPRMQYLKNAKGYLTESEYRKFLREIKKRKDSGFGRRKRMRRPINYGFGQFL